MSDYDYCSVCGGRGDHAYGCWWYKDTTMNQDSHVTQRLTEAQVQKPIHRARHNMVWHLEWHGEGVFLDGAPIPVYRIGQFATMRAAHEYVIELASRFNQASYSLTRI